MSRPFRTTTGSGSGMSGTSGASGNSGTSGTSGTSENAGSPGRTGAGHGSLGGLAGRGALGGPNALGFRSTLGGAGGPGTKTGTGASSRSIQRGRLPIDGEVVQFALLTIGTEPFALDIMRIRAIVNPLRITPVPKAPPFVEGVIELRGSILPVVDMRKRFDLPAPPPVRSTKYVLVGLEGRIVGLIVDGVTEVIRLPRQDVRPAPAMAVGESAQYFSGVCQHGGRIVMVIDLDAILSTSERISLAGLAAAR